MLYHAAGITTLLALGFNVVDVALEMGESELFFPAFRLQHILSSVMEMMTFYGYHEEVKLVVDFAKMNNEIVN